MKLRPMMWMALGVLLAGCEDGTLILSVADAPVDEASSVVLQISEIELLREDGDDRSFTFSPPRQVDLLEFTGGESTILLDRVRIPEGDYTGFRLTIDTDNATQSHVDPTVGTAVRLVLRDGGNQITIDEPFTVEQREELALTIDFDLRRSVLSRDAEGEPFEFDAVTRLVADEDAATITGEVAAGLVDAPGCTPVVYVYNGHDVDPDDVGSGTNPVGSAAVKSRTVSAALTYKVAFLLAGDYTVALTCDAANDDPSVQDDDVEFISEAEVSVEDGETATANFAD